MASRVAASYVGYILPLLCRRLAVHIGRWWVVSHLDVAFMYSSGSLVWLQKLVSCNLGSSGGSVRKQ